MVLDAVTLAPTHTGVRGTLAQHHHAVKVDNHGYLFIVLSLHHLFLHHLEDFLLFEGIILKQELIINQQDIAHILFGEEVNQLRNNSFWRYVFL